MRLLSQNNYWTESGHGQDWRTEFAPWPSSHTTFYYEAIQSAMRIVDERIGHVYVMYSGGIDSEFAVNVFRRIQAPFTPVIVKMKYGLNYHDFRYAQDYCAQHRLEPLIIDLDFEEFVTSGKLLSTAEQMETHIYQYATLGHICSQIDGTVVVCAGEPEVRLQPSGKWNVTINEYDFAIDRYFKKTGVYGVPSFPTCTPEMVMAFLKHPSISAFAEGKRPGRIGSNSGRRAIYLDGSEFIIPDRPKYTGYEIVEQQPFFNHETFAILAEKEKMYNGIFSEDYYQFLKRFQSEGM